MKKIHIVALAAFNLVFFTSHAMFGYQGGLANQTMEMIKDGYVTDTSTIERNIFQLLNRAKGTNKTAQREIPKLLWALYYRLEFHKNIEENEFTDRLKILLETETPGFFIQSFYPITAKEAAFIENNLKRTEPYVSADELSQSMKNLDIQK